MNKYTFLDHISGIIGSIIYLLSLKGTQWILIIVGLSIVAFPTFVPIQRQWIAAIGLILVILGIFRSSFETYVTNSENEYIQDQRQQEWKKKLK